MDADRIRAIIQESAKCISELGEQAEKVVAAGDMVIEALKAGNKVLTAGNGGSAAEALHMSEELIGRYRSDRPSLASVSLVADTTALTCIGNDFGFDRIFSRQIEGLGKEGDVLVLFSTSGNAENLRLAQEAAASKGLKTVSFLGRDGGAIAGKADIEIIAPGPSTERIQETHQLLVHLVLDAVEEANV